MDKVIVFKSGLLPFSETFIKEQFISYKNWHAILVGTHREPGVDLGNQDVRLFRNSRNIFRRIYWRCLKEIGTPYADISRKLRREKAKIFHVHFGNEAVEFWSIAEILNLPLVVTLHGSDINICKEWWQAGHGGVHHVSYPERLLSLAKNPNVHFVAVSEAIRQQAIEYGLPPERIKVIFIGIDTRRFFSQGVSLLARPKRILYVGRMVEKKGGWLLIEAFAKIHAKYPEVELVMIGGGPLLDSYKDLAKKLNAPVEFTGALSSAEVKAAMDGARIFCLPSITALNGDAEGLPIVILEAQACGLPVVTSARGGATEGIIDGVTGFAFREKDSEALYAHLEKLLTDDDLALKMSEAATSFIINNFDISACTSKLESFYNRLISRS